MTIIRASNVNSAYLQAIEYVREIGVREETRAGPALVAPHPVLTQYLRPTERVLLDPGRDANPFFHLFESLWMLAGRNDSAFLDRFVRNFGSQFAERGGTLHGAYGHRWRQHWDQDQLAQVIMRLRRDPGDRRVVISMWDPQSDLITPDFADVDDQPLEDWPTEPKDLPCNTHAYPRIRRVPDPAPVADWYSDGTETRTVLDLTVCCRSNDVIWGAYGANAVHFSVLQEYLAARIGVGVGTLYQFSNNWHAYESALAKVGSPSIRDPYRGDRAVTATPMFESSDHVDQDIRRFLQDPDVGAYANSWFRAVARPMWRAHDAWRERDPVLAASWAEQIEASDWRRAAQEWLARRAARAPH